MPKLTLVMERTALRTYELDRPVVRIGRGEGMDIVIQNVSVSREQAEIRDDGRQWSVRDLGSVNGTFVNGERLSAASRVLAPGDEISFGKFSLFFERVLDTPAAPVTITPDEGRDRAGTYMLTMEDIERIHHSVTTKRQPQLHWEIAGQQGTFYIKSDSVRVGRAADCELRLPIGPARTVVVTRAAQGFEVRRDTGWLTLTPLWVNGRMVRQALLKNGDRIQLGDLHLTFLDEI